MLLETSHIEKRALTKNLLKTRKTYNTIASK